MAVGDRTADSIIWVPGESHGKNYVGDSVSAPTTANQAEAETYTDVQIAAAEAAATGAVTALHARLVASGVLPN